MAKTLFPKIPGLLHGGDYNPEQWLDRPDILEEDIRLMKEAGVNTVTLGVFSWSVYEPVEGEYHFEWLKEIMDNLYEAGIYTVLATPSGARPAWLDEKYPEALRTTQKRIKNLHGQRHNHCITSPKYRELVRKMDEKLVENFGDHPGLILWHISNELGGECACELCQERFREYLRERFDNNIEKLNQEWWTTFWSHRYNDFSQIEGPAVHGEKSIHGLNLEWKRFTTHNTIDFINWEAEILREKTPNIPITTNFMHMYPALDYDKVSKVIDIISWDSYPRYGNPDSTLYDISAENAMDHVMMRSLKRDTPIMMMESVPSIVNWFDFNKLKRPGEHRVTAMQAIACGSDTVQYFQWRKGRGSYEQYHGAVLDHLGRNDTRVFKDVAEVGALLKKVSEVAGSVTKSEAAILFDWDNWWAINDAAAFSEKTKNYTKTILETFKLFMKNGADVDILSPLEDLSQYKVIVAPMMYLVKPGVADALKAFVKGGGQLITTYITGYVNENTLCFLGGFPGDGLTELFGLYTEEIDTLYPKDKNGVAFAADSPVQGTYSAKDYCEIVKLLGAKTLATYTADFYEGTPAVTVNQYGEGNAYYVATRMDQSGMNALLKQALKNAGIAYDELPEGVEYHRRQNDTYAYDFYLNYTREEKVVNVAAGTDIVGDREVSGETVLGPLGVMICRVQL